MKKHLHRKSLIDDEDLPLDRLQALVDGIFAIAMTLLVLEIHLPDLGSVKNGNALLLSLFSSWPQFLSFFISFIILATFWVAHHTEFHYIKKLDHKLIWINIFYLLLVSFFPFTADLVGRYTYNETAVIIYALHLMIMVLLHYFMWRHVRKRKNLLKENIDERIDKVVNRLTFFAVIAYALAIALSLWRTEAALVIYALVPLPYIFGWIYKLA